MKDYYEYLGKAPFDVAPLVDYLKSSIIPLYENSSYRNMVCSLRTEKSVATGYPPIFLNEDWRVDKDATYPKHFWCLPFKYDDDSAMFVISGPKLHTMFPSIFFPNTPWHSKLQKYLDKAQIIITNGDSSKHKDVGGRVSSINTFLFNTDKSVTEFWNDTDKVSEIRYEEGDTYLLNVRQYHQIKQTSKDTRCVLSWGYFLPFEKSLNEIRSS